MLNWLKNLFGKKEVEASKEQRDFSDFEGRTGISVEIVDSTPTDATIVFKFKWDVNRIDEFAELFFSLNQGVLMDAMLYLLNDPSAPHYNEQQVSQINNNLFKLYSDLLKGKLNDKERRGNKPIIDPTTMFIPEKKVRDEDYDEGY